MSENKLEVVVKTLPHLEDLLVEELIALGSSEVRKAKRAVHCSMSKKQLYAANLQLRTGLRVLVVIAEFSIRDVDDIYKRGIQVEWDKYLTTEMTFAIDPNVHSRLFRHEHFASLRLKDAIADYFNKKYDRRPDVQVEHPDVQWHLHVDEHKVSISMDSSGESLNRRGYRRAGARAPLNEVLAAGMVLLSGWRGETDFYDPMCGSGTLGIEAYNIARNIPSQILRKQFGFFGWLDFEENIWKEVLAEAKQKIKPLEVSINLSDANTQAVGIARENIRMTGAMEYLKPEVRDFFEVLPKSERGVLIMNPPYGERIEEDQLILFYKRIGDTFKKQWPGFNAWIISSNMPALKSVGLRPSARIPLMNGQLECRFMKFELFSGSRIDKVLREKGGSSS